MSHPRPTRNEVIEAWVLLVVTVGLLVGLDRGVVSRQLLPFITTAYVTYVAFMAIRALEWWLTRNYSKRI